MQLFQPLHAAHSNNNEDGQAYPRLTLAPGPTVVWYGLRGAERHAIEIRNCRMDVYLTTMSRTAVCADGSYDLSY